MELFPNHLVVVGASADEVLVLAALGWAGLDGALRLCSLPTSKSNSPLLSCVPLPLPACWLSVLQSSELFPCVIVTMLGVAARGSEKRG